MLTDPNIDAGPLVMPSAAEGRRLGEFFKESGYTLENLTKTLGTPNLASQHSGNVPALLDRTEAPSALNVLLRSFWLAVPQSEEAVRSALPGWVLDMAVASKMLRKEGKDFAASVMVLPMDDIPVVCDQPARLAAGEADTVLWPNPTTRTLSRFTVRRPCKTVLDIGTGNCAQALLAASHCEKVVATDVNARALNFSAFNALLNGCENIEFVFGGGFDPVGGRKFDLVVCNPPFFLSPEPRYVFCDSPLELDGLCRQLVKGAGEHLCEGGFFQMVCEWPEIKGQPWQERIEEWFEGSGCDVWVMKSLSRDSASYAMHRVQEMAWSMPGKASQHCWEYIDFYKRKGVEAVHNGIVAMRRRSGRNWLAIEEVAALPQAEFGEFVLRGFAARDFLQVNATDAQLLDMKPSLAPEARLNQTLEPGKPGWNSTSLVLTMGKDYPFTLALQPLVAEFLGGCDGVRTLGELTKDLAQKVNAPPEQVQRECVEIMRRLIMQGCALFS
jgi:methylase of polypeptide subunit release factors